MEQKANGRYDQPTRAARSTNTRSLVWARETHPLEYGGFEGTIPKGEYGAGTVELWDRGTWEPEADAHEGLRKGDFKFTLRGEKLKGSWALVRMKSRPGEEDKENWLLIKGVEEDGRRDTRVAGPVFRSPLWHGKDEREPPPCR